LLGVAGARARDEHSGGIDRSNGEVRTVWVEERRLERSKREMRENGKYVMKRRMGCEGKRCSGSSGMDAKARTWEKGGFHGYARLERIP